MGVINNEKDISCGIISINILITNAVNLESIC